MAENPPLCFTRLFGQAKARRMLQRSLARQRVPHAYIFKGPEGVGRKLYAKGFAAAVNCRNTATRGACGGCTSCVKIRSGNHPDLMVISPEGGGIKIDQVRKLCRDLTFPPYESSLRVVILEDVHTMRLEAANSLLKTLEEPPENNLLILTADSSREILATLTSRCQVVPFSGLQHDDIVTILGWHGVDPDEAQLFAHLSGGSPGKALLLTDTGIVGLWREIVSIVSVDCGTADSNLGAVLQLAARMAELKDHLEYLLVFLRVWLKDLLVVHHRYASAGGTILPFLKQEAGVLKSWSSEQLFAKLRAIDAAERALSRNCNRLLVCEILLFKLQ